MARWVFPVAIVVLLLNLVALLFTLSGDSPASAVLGLAVVADLAVAITLVPRSRATFTNSVAESVLSSADEAVNQQPIIVSAPGQPTSTNPVTLEPEPETVNSATEARWTKRRAPSEVKEDLLENFQWLGLVEDCVELEGELADLLEHLDGSSQQVVDHTILRLQEILERSNVEIIADESTFDLARHKAEPAHSILAPSTTITATLCPGFAVGPRVLRRALVRISDSPSLNEGNSSTKGRQ